MKRTVFDKNLKTQIIDCFDANPNISWPVFHKKFPTVSTSSYSRYKQKANTRTPTTIPGLGLVQTIYSCNKKLDNNTKTEIITILEQINTFSKFSLELIESQLGYEIRNKTRSR